MKIAKFLAVSISLFAGSHAFAQYSVSSQYQHQANKHDLEITPEVSSGSIKYNYGSGNTAYSSWTNQYLNASVMGEYGISDMVSIGVILGYQKDNYSVSANGATASDNVKGDGMIDPTIFLNARADTGGGILRYGAAARFAAGHMSVGGTSTNEYSGGMTFTPYVGYEYIFGISTVGARVTYDLVQTDRTVDGQGGSAKLKNGNEMTATAFYEMNYKPVIIGIDVGLLNYTSTTSDVGGSLTNAYNSIKYDVYAAWTLADNLTLIPQVGYGTSDTAGAQAGRLLQNSVSSSGGLNGSLALRISF